MRSQLEYSVGSSNCCYWGISLNLIFSEIIFSPVTSPSYHKLSAFCTRNRPPSFDHGTYWVLPRSFCHREWCHVGLVFPQNRQSIWQNMNILTQSPTKLFFGTPLFSDWPKVQLVYCAPCSALPGFWCTPTWLYMRPSNMRKAITASTRRCNMNNLLSVLTTMATP